MFLSVLCTHSMSHSDIPTRGVQGHAPLENCWILLTPQMQFSAFWADFKSLLYVKSEIVSFSLKFSSFFKLDKFYHRKPRYVSLITIVLRILSNRENRCTKLKLQKLLCGVSLEITAFRIHSFCFFDCCYLLIYDWAVAFAFRKANRGFFIDQYLPTHVILR